MAAVIQWTGDAMAYAKAHVAVGVLRIDDDGRIWRTAVRSGDGWKPIPERRAENPGAKGYLRISLWISERRRLATVMAHCLVYEVKVGPIPPGLQINHDDLDKTNNRPGNLEPVTGAKNIQHSYANGRTVPWSMARKTGGTWRGRPMVTEAQRQRAREMRASGAPLRRIAAELGIGISHAHRITNGGSP